MEEEKDSLKPIKCGKYELRFDKTLIMGILNITPDSFSGDGITDTEEAIKRAKKMVSEGADIIDVGGESSRPGSKALSADEELKRIEPVINKLVQEVNIPISVDTYKPEVAERCLEMGASMINDIYGLKNEELISVIAKYNAPVVIMHMQGNPNNMQNNPNYDNVVEDIYNFFENQINKAKKAGINNIIIDPGIGFGKTPDNNLEILRNLEKFKTLGYPLFLGVSRKSFIEKISGVSVEQRLEGSLAAATCGIMNGANIVRVHDVYHTKRAIEIVDAIIGK